MIPNLCANDLEALCERHRPKPCFCVTAHVRQASRIIYPSPSVSNKASTHCRVEDSSCPVPQRPTASGLVLWHIPVILGRTLAGRESGLERSAATSKRNRWHDLLHATSATGFL